MKIYRAPQTAKKWTNVTDTKSLAKAEKWYPGKIFHLDGTVQKGGVRHTDLGVEFEADDIIALYTALQEHQERRLRELESLNRRFSKKVKFLEDEHFKRMR